MSARALLGPQDAPPAMVREGAGLLLTCEHAGRAVPRALGDLGVARADMDDHIGWDAGALEVAEALAETLGAALVSQPYSRLVIDCNRPRGAPDLVPAVSDGRAVPANDDLADDDLEARWQGIHRPFHEAVAARAASRPGLLSVHSFSPRRAADPAPRPWHFGVLARRANPLAARLLERLPEVWPDGPVAANVPYEIEDASDYTIPVHAEPRRLPHALLEIRSDLIASPAGARRAAAAIAAALEDA